MGLLKTQTNVDFYQKLLDQVSRSFAVCISELKYPLREQVGLSYLLCRVLDTVEDAPWSQRAFQAKSFDQLKKFLLGKLEPDLFELWIDSIPKSIPLAEKDLINKSFKLFEDLNALDAGPRKIIRMAVLNMLAGMRHFCSLESEKKIVINSNLEMNQYCFFVAGVVGEMLTELVEACTPELEWSHDLLMNGIHFGLFLQKVNILKDQRTDEREGRFFISSRNETRSEIFKNMNHAFSYIEQIPVSRKDYRVFCSWSLFLGVASLPWIEKSFKFNADLKIPRTETFTILTKVKNLIDEPEELKKYFLELVAMATAEQPQNQLRNQVKLPNNVPQWLLNSYQGTLRSQDFISLGIGC